jgi:hypothetical protein
MDGVEKTKGLRQNFLKCGSSISSISWELITNVNDGAPLCTPGGPEIPEVSSSNRCFNECSRKYMELFV